jgi:signal transduction histidine kinase
MTALRALSLCLLASTAVPAVAEGPRRVLILHSLGRDFAPFSAIAPEFRTALAQRSPRPIEFLEASVETSRFVEGEGEGPLVEYLRSLFAKRPLDLVVPFGGPAVLFCLRNRERMFPSVPVLLAGMDRRRLHGLTLDHETAAVPMDLDLPGLIESILRLVPDTGTVAVVFGDSPLERYWGAQLHREWEPLAKRVDFIWLNELPLGEMQKRVAALPPRSVIFYGMLNMDAAGVPYEQDRALPALHAVARSPIFGSTDNLLGLGIVGGPLVPLKEMGQETARVAVRILGGESPGSVVTRPLAGKPAYDWRELQRWGISEARLPTGSDVRFRSPTFWALYGWLIPAATSVCLGEAFLIVFLVRRGRELQRARTALQESAVGMRLAANAGRLTLWTWDVQRDEVLTTEEGRALFDWGESEPLTLEGFIATLHPDDREATRLAIGRSLADSEAYEAEYRAVLADGSTRWVVARGRVERDAKGRPAVLRGVAVDITARKQAEMEVLRQRSDLAHLNRAAMLGELSGSIAHELNQPLTAILSNSQAAVRLLANDDADLEEMREILNDIVDEDKRAGEVIRRLRLLLKKGEVQQVSLPLNDVVEDVLKLLRSDLLNQGVTAEVALAPVLPPVDADRVQLQQVLLNLVMNACDAMSGTPPGDHTLVIRTGVIEGEGVCVSVADRGVGIAAETLDSVFEPFFTTKAHGMGLGLSVCRTIIAAHGGRLWASRNPDRGATFHFTLPIAAEGNS